MCFLLMLTTRRFFLPEAVLVCLFIHRENDMSNNSATVTLRISLLARRLSYSQNGQQQHMHTGLLSAYTSSLARHNLFVLLHALSHTHTHYTLRFARCM